MRRRRCGMFHRLTMDLVGRRKINREAIKIRRGIDEVCKILNAK